MTATPDLQHMTMPHDSIAERSLLGAVLMNGDRYHDVSHLLTAGDFYRQFNRWVWDAMTQLMARGEPIDLVTVAGLLNHGKSSDDGEAVRVELMRLAADYPSSNVVAYANRVLGASQLRTLIGALQDAMTTAYAADHLDAAEVVQRIEADIYRSVGRTRNRGTSTYHLAEDYISDTTADVLERWDLLDAGAEDVPQIGISTGLYDLDNAMGRLRKGKFYVLGGRPGMGKSTLAAQMARQASAQGYRVNMHVLEMGERELALRDLAATSLVTFKTLDEGHGTAADRAALDIAHGELRARPMAYDTDPYATLASIRSQALRTISEYGGLDVIIVDYIQLMDAGEQPGKRAAENRQVEVSRLSRGLRTLSLELDVAVVACCQLSRALEQRFDKRPMLSDLRESGSLEQDADIVLFCYRDEVYDDLSADAGVAEILVAKYRGGKTGVARVGFDGPRMRFTNMARAWETPPDGGDTARPALSVVKPF